MNTPPVWDEGIGFSLPAKSLPVSHHPTLSERIGCLVSTAASVSSGLFKDLRMIEMHVARAEEHLLRCEQKNSSWTRPDLLALIMGEGKG